MYLLDTNVISELRKRRPHGALLAWFNAQRTAELILPAVVIYELQSGANRTRNQDPHKAHEIDLWIERLLDSFLLLPFGADEARMTADFMNKRSLDLLPDTMIAATAAVYSFTVATRNIADFKGLPVRLLNPFQP